MFFLFQDRFFQYGIHLGALVVLHLRYFLFLLEFLVTLLGFTTQWEPAGLGNGLPSPGKLYAYLKHEILSTLLNLYSKN